MDTLVDLLSEAAHRWGPRPAVATSAGLRHEEWSYSTLLDAARSIADHLHSGLGLEAGARVALWAPNSPRLVATLFGAMLAQLVVVPIDPTATPRFVSSVVAATRARVIVAGHVTGEALGAEIVPIDQLPLDGEPLECADGPLPGDVAEIVFTSGTTGTPKGVVLTHRNIVTNVRAALELVPRRPLRLVSILPLSHMLEQTVGLLGPMVLGSSIYYPTSRSAPVLRKAMRRRRVTAMVLVPQALQLMLRGIEAEVDRRGLAQRWHWALRTAGHLPLRLRRLLFREAIRGLGGELDFVICGGARLPAKLEETWERMGIRVVEGYGATECAPVIAANTYWHRAPGTVGHPLPGVVVRLSDDHEILVKGPNVTAGYWENAAATAGAFDHDGYYRTGDLGAWDSAGRLVLTGRLTDRIVLASGLNVYPDDVERELREEALVVDCVVVAIPDAAGNPRLHAVVIPAVGVDDQEPAVAEAARRANDRLAPHQRIAGVTVWPEPDFPRTNLRKVKRHEVAAAVRAGAGPSEKLPAPPPMTGNGGDPLGALVARVAGVAASSLDDGTDLALDAGLDSLGRIELGMLLEDELGVEIDETELATARTFGELRALGAGEVGSPVQPSAPEWPRRRTATALRSLLQRLLLFPLHRLVARPFDVAGAARLDATTGPILVIANHSSHLDTPSILRALPGRLSRRAAVAAAADYFYRSRALGAITSLLLGTFPFSREGAVRASLEKCGELVDDHWSIVLYPEGTRSTTGAMGPFRSGIGLLAGELGVPIVPVGIVGTHATWPKGTRWPRRGPVTVRFGEPIEVEPGVDRTELVARLERAVGALVVEHSPPGHTEQLGH